MPPMPPGMAGAEVLLRLLGDHGFGRHQQAGHGGRVLERRAHDLGRVDDAGLQQVLELAGLGVPAICVVRLLAQLPDDDRTLGAGILGYLADRSLDGAANDVDADLLVVVGGLDVVAGLGGTQERHAAARKDAFLDGRTGGVQRVVDAVLLFLDLDLGRAADADHGNTAGELRQAFLQLLAVVVRGRLLDLGLDLVDAALDLGFGSGSVDDGRVFLGDRHLLRAAEHFQRDVLELDAEVLGDAGAAGEDGDVLEHGLAAVAEARSLDGRDLEAAAQLVDDERRKGFALDVLGDDQQRLAGLDHGFENGKQRLEVRQLLLVDQDVGILELGPHLVLVGHEVGRQVATVELHALDDLELGLGGLGFLDRDDTLVADLLHRLREEAADLGVAIGGDRTDLGDLGVIRDLAGIRLEFGDDGVDRLVDAALQVHRVHAGGNRLGTFADDRLRKHGCRRRAVAGEVVRLRGDFAHHLRAHVLELVLELDLLGDGDAVLGDARRAERLVDDDVAALRAERDLHRVCEDVDAAQHAVARVGMKLYFFCSHDLTPCIGSSVVTERRTLTRPAFSRLLVR